MGFSLFSLFKKPNVEQLDAFYRKLSIKTFNWMALAVNQRTIEGSSLTKELALSGNKTPSFSWQTAEAPDGQFHLVNSGNKSLFNEKVLHKNELQNCKNNFNQLIDNLIEENLGHFHTAFKNGTQSMRQLEAEEKALEWLRVSFEVLSKAIIESLTNPEFLFQSTFFAGINPKTSKREIRLITFNLDMTFILLDDYDLRVIIYNKGSKENFDNLSPVLIGDYSAKKREIIDQLTSLLAVLSKGFHLP